MKKLLLAIFSISLLFQSVFAYSPTFKDILIVRQLSNAIEELISDKGVEYRDIYLERLESIKVGYSHKERIVYIIEGTIEKLSPVDLVDDILDNLAGNNCTTEGESYGSIGLESEACCSGLEELDYIGGSTICYDPNIGLPTCKYIAAAGFSYLTYPTNQVLGWGTHYECDIEETTNSCTEAGNSISAGNGSCCPGLTQGDFPGIDASIGLICYESSRYPTCKIPMGYTTPYLTTTDGTIFGNGWPCVMQSNTLDTFEFDISDMEPSEHQWVSIQIEATNAEGDAMNSYNEDVILRFERKTNSGLWDECDDDELNINGDSFSEDESDLDDDGEIEVELEYGELEFEVNFEYDGEFRISIEDITTGIMERRIIEVD